MVWQYRGCLRWRVCLYRPRPVYGPSTCCTEPRQEPTMTKQLDLKDKIGSMVQTIVEDANKRHPHAMDELMHIHHECSNDTTLVTALATDVSELSKAIKAETAAFEVLRASLGLI